MEVKNIKDLMFPIYTLLQSNKKMDRGEIFVGLVSMGFKDKVDKSKAKGKQSVLKGRMGFALSWMKMIEPIATNTHRGVWELTSYSKINKLSQEDMDIHYEKCRKELASRNAKKRNAGKNPSETIFDDEPSASEKPTSNKDLITTLVKRGVMGKVQAYDLLVGVG